MSIFIYSIPPLFGIAFAAQVYIDIERYKEYQINIIYMYYDTTRIHVYVYAYAHIHYVHAVCMHTYTYTNTHTYMITRAIGIYPNVYMNCINNHNKIDSLSIPSAHRSTY